MGEASDERTALDRMTRTMYFAIGIATIIFGVLLSGGPGGFRGQLSQVDAPVLWFSVATVLVLPASFVVLGRVLPLAAMRGLVTASALPFFALTWESVKRSYASRLAIFRGGMTDVMAAPLARSIERRGGRVLVETPVERLAADGRVVDGVYAHGLAYRAPRVVLATPIAPAKRILEATWGAELPDDPELRKLAALPEMSGVAVQLELDRAALPDDHPIFGPNSILGTFAEQSHVTFRGSPGRISTFLSPSEPYMAMSDEDVDRFVNALARVLARG